MVYELRLILLIEVDGTLRRTYLTHLENLTVLTQTPVHHLLFNGTKVTGVESRGKQRMMVRFLKWD